MSRRVNSTTIVIASNKRSFFEFKLKEHTYKKLSKKAKKNKNKKGQVHRQLVFGNQRIGIGYHRRRIRRPWQCGEPQPRPPACNLLLPGRFLSTHSVWGSRRRTSWAASRSTHPGRGRAQRARVTARVTAGARYGRAELDGHEHTRSPSAGRIRPPICMAYIGQQSSWQLVENY